MAPRSTMVREYASRKEFEKDANKLAKDGWAVVTQSEQTQRSGCARFLLIGPLALIFHPKSHIAVTYNRTS